MYEENGKLNVIFDGSVLTNGLCNDSRKSGVFFVAYKLLDCFLKNDAIDLFLFLPNGSTYEAEKLKKLEIIPSNFSNIITTKLPAWCYKLLEYSNQNRKNLLPSIIRFIYNRLKRIGKIFCNKKLKKYCDSQKRTIYFSPLNNIPNYISKNKKIKSYMLIHDLIPVLFKDFYKHYGIYRMQKMEKILSSLSPNIKYFTVSNSTKNDLLSINPSIKSENIVVTYPSISHISPTKNKTSANELRAKYNIPNDKKYILSLCSIEPRKNIIFAIQNYLNFINKHNINDLVFVVGGGVWKEYKDTYEKFLGTVPKERVINIGYVNDEDVFELYSNARIFVYPSIYEGFGLPVLEAMNAGCPVITSNTSSLPEVIGDAGIQINPKSNEEMVNAYEKMYFDTNYREDCIKKGLERAIQFSWEECASTMYKQFCKDFIDETSI